MEQSKCAQCRKGKQIPLNMAFKDKSHPVKKVGQSRPKSFEWVTDFITGKKVPDVGAEANRQAVERYLVENKGYLPENIQVDAPIKLTIGGEPYRSTVDLVVSVAGKRYMVIKCAPGSLGSREREAVSAARLLDRSYQIPLAVVSDGRTATVLDTTTGKKIDAGLESLPSREVAAKKSAGTVFQVLAENRCEREKLIFRSYDSMNVNVGHRTGMNDEC
ncbi:MAG: hypothetical protein B6I22_11115 [Desulfobacteraceae bacterium 4572_123]|nr:MAG: hypothetical protein B6I22_11115 [Desulfobacteraceae bacterium 4572_123]